MHRIALFGRKGSRNERAAVKQQQPSCSPLLLDADLEPKTSGKKTISLVGYEQSSIFPSAAVRNTLPV
jgi:hypothetical protein